MTIALQHKEFDIRANKIDTNNYINLKPSQKDSFLNEASLFICNHYGELFEFQKTQFNKDLFGTLLVKYPDQPELYPSLAGDTYEVLFSNLKYDYLHLDSAYVKCGSQYVTVKMLDSDSQGKLNTAFQKPSFKWKRLLGTIGKSSTGQGSSLYIYSDVNLTSYPIRIEYIKKPVKVFFGYYDSIEYLDCIKRETEGFDVENCNQYYKSTDTPVNSDLPETYHSLQVDVAVWLATGKTENQFISNFISNKLSAMPK